MKALINTPCGQIQGIEHEDYIEWRGVKYAEAGRWEDPRQVTHWDGVYDATEWGDRSMQYWGIYYKPDSPTALFYMEQGNKSVDGRVVWSEDSLNLNIFSPVNAEKTPVLFYIHGGGFLSGQNTDPYETTGSFAKEGVVSVFINYRLGLWGQAMDEEHTGNYGIKDQVTALKWVYENIAAFGGDPERITICGESAGAFSVTNLLHCPLAKDMIHGAIMMSGAGDMPHIGVPGDREVLLNIWKDLKESLGIKSLDEVKAMPPKDIFEAWQKVAYKNSVFPAGPVEDGLYMAESSDVALAENKVADVPIMIGMLAQDMWPATVYDAAMHYAEERAAKGGKPVYMYFLDYPVHPVFGAYHAADCHVAFRAVNLSRIERNEEITKVEEDLFHRFKNFVLTGDPNGEGERTWLSAAESGNKWYELSGKDHGMYAPDKEALIAQQHKKIPFPVSENWGK